MGGQGGCERRIEVFVKIQKKFWGGRGGGGSGRGVGLVGGGVGVRVDVNAILGVGGNVVYEGFEPRIEGTVQCTKRYCTILRKLKKWGGGGGVAIFKPKTLKMY